MATTTTTKKSEEQLLDSAQAVQEQTGAEAAAQQQSSTPDTAQTAYSTQGLTNKTAVENALAGAQYTPSQSVTDAAAALKEWQDSRPADYTSAYQERIDSLLDQLLSREAFQYSYAQDPLYRQYAQAYTQNAYNASADAAAQAAALTGGYGSSYAASAAQQAYQQQMTALNNVIPTLYSLALDTYSSGGDALVDQIDLLSAQEQNAQSLYNQELEDYYTQLEQKGQAYNDAYAQDYGQFVDYLNRLDDLRSYYSNQEQLEQARNQQIFQNVMSVLAMIGNAVQLAITGTTGLGTLANGLINTGYNIYADSRDYEAQRADTAWEQQMQELLRQDDLTQQQYENETAQKQYQDALAQQQFDNNVTSQKLAIAQGEWALKQAAAAQQAASASTSSSGTTSRTVPGGMVGALGTTIVPYEAVRLRSLGKSDLEIYSTLSSEGYTDGQIDNILKQMNGS